jgi:hypothetical protein
MRSMFAAVSGLLALALLADVGRAKADTVISVDPGATYLLTSNDPNALDSPAISLSSLGIQDGQKIFLQAIGDFCFSIFNPAGCAASEVPSFLVGVFSSSNSLLGSTNLNRVAGAIQTSDGINVVTGNTLMGGLATDIPQDFGIPHDPGSTTVTVPQGANYLFVSVSDSFYGDNGDRMGIFLCAYPALPSRPASFLLARSL